MKTLFDDYIHGDPFKFPELAEVGSMNAREIFAKAMPELAQEIPEDMTMDEFSDIQRVMVQVTDVAAYKAFLDTIPSWTLAAPNEILEGRSRYAGPGAHIGSIPFQGDSAPAYAFPAVTMAFDQTDPALQFFQQEIAEAHGETGVAFLLATADPLFQGVISASGVLRGFILHGGWLYADGIWSPFLLSSKGPDDALVQRKFHRGDLASRGLIRERGLDPKLMSAACDYQARLITVRDHREEIFSENDALNVPETVGRPSFTTAQDPSGWSMLADEQMASLYGHY